MTGAESVAWADLLKTAVRMSGDLTSAVRQFQRTTGSTLHSMQSVGVVSGEEFVRDSLVRFAVAARTALLDRVIQLLSDDEASASFIAPSSLILWVMYVAARTHGERHLHRDGRRERGHCRRAHGAHR